MLGQLSAVQLSVIMPYSMEMALKKSVVFTASLTVTRCASGASPLQQAPAWLYAQAAGWRAPFIQVLSRRQLHLRSSRLRQPPEAQRTSGGTVRALTASRRLPLPIVASMCCFS